MLVRLEEMKLYLRVDSDEEDELITHLLESAEKVCMDVVRGDANALDMAANAKTAIMYTAAYFMNTGKKQITGSSCSPCVLYFLQKEGANFSADCKIKSAC